jgi:hypothetical protein
VEAERGRGECSARMLPVLVDLGVALLIGTAKFGGEKVELTSLSDIREMITCSLGVCFVSPNVGT